MLDDLAEILVSKGLGVKGSSIFSYVPDEPDALLAVLPYGGTAGGMRSSSGLALDAEPRFQLYSRAKDDAVAEANLKAAADALHVRNFVASSGNRYFFIQSLNEPIRLKVDSKDRFVWTVNFQTHYRKAN